MKILKNGEIAETIQDGYVTIKRHFIDDTVFGALVYEVEENDNIYLNSDFEMYYQERRTQTA